VRKFAFAAGVLNVGPEVTSWEDDYEHEQLLRQLGDYDVGAPGQGFGTIELGLARIEVDAPGLEQALRDAGFDVEP
jgi:hypothetical protein